MTRRRAIALGCALGLALGAISAAPSLVAYAQELTPIDGAGEPVDFSLEETSGATRTLSEARGRVVVVFFEDRDHVEENRELKLTLHEFVRGNHLEEQVRTYAVANVDGIDGVLRDVARQAIRAVASRYGIQILLDWDGTLLASPFDCANSASNVLLLDRAGRIRWRHSGPFTATDRTAFFRALRHLIREPQAH